MQLNIHAHELAMVARLPKKTETAAIREPSTSRKGFRGGADDGRTSAQSRVGTACRPNARPPAIIIAIRLIFF
jgi:hypothetical protein